MENARQVETLYREKLFPSINTTLSLLMPLPIAWLAAFPFSPYLGLAMGSAISILCYAIVWTKSPRITLTTEELQVGVAKLPLAEIQEFGVVRGEQAQIERGPNRHPKAFVSLRGTASKLVKISLASEIDPTPYWLIGSRNPERLVQAVRKAKG